MTAKNNADPEDSPLGVLDDATSVDTAGIGILGGTAQVRVTLPAEEDDDLADDGVVDGEVGIDLVVDALTLPGGPVPAAEPAAALVAEEGAAARFLAKAGADRAEVPAAKPAHGHHRHLHLW